MTAKILKQDQEWIIDNLQFKVLRLENDLKISREETAEWKQKYYAVLRSYNIALGSLNNPERLKKAQKIAEGMRKEMCYKRAGGVLYAPKFICLVVMDYFKVSGEQLASPYRGEPVKTARHWLTYLFTNHTKLSYRQMGDILGGRDHTTIMNAKNQVDLKRQDHTETYKNLIALLETNYGL
jgi:chromosomal replication initiation ATPase DnaA